MEEGKFLTEIRIWDTRDKKIYLVTDGKLGYITKYDFYSHPQQIHYLFQIIFLKCH